MTPTPPEALRKMGAIFDEAAKHLECAMLACGSALEKRIKNIDETIANDEAELARCKEAVLSLQGRIAAFRAERAHHAAQTGLDLLRAVVAEPRAEVEKMAERDRIIGDTPLVETTMPTEEAMQPTTKPPEDDDPVERAFWRFCMLIDKTQRASRVKAGYLEGPYPQRDAFKIAVRSTVLGLGAADHVADAAKNEQADAPEQAPALLDLRGLKVGTVCEATGAIQTVDTIIGIGERFTITYANDGSNRWPVHVERNNATRFVPALVPARVV